MERRGFGPYIQGKFFYVYLFDFFLLTEKSFGVLMRSQIDLWSNDIVTFFFFPSQEGILSSRQLFIPFLESWLRGHIHTSQTVRL